MTRRARHTRRPEEMTLNDPPPSHTTTRSLSRTTTRASYELLHQSHRSMFSPPRMPTFNRTVLRAATGAQNGVVGYLRSAASYAQPLAIFPGSPRSVPAPSQRHRDRVSGLLLKLQPPLAHLLIHGTLLDILGLELLLHLRRPGAKLANGLRMRKRQCLQLTRQMLHPLQLSERQRGLRSNNAGSTPRALAQTTSWIVCIV